MKKVLAVLLAALMAFSVFCVSSAAEETTGAVYDLADGAIPCIKAVNGEVVILQPGDSIRLTEITGNTTSAPKRVEVRYYPDAASLKAKDLTNLDWKTNVVPKYNLDTTKWELEKGQTVDDLLAKSPNHYKSFYTFGEYQKTDVPVVTALALNGENAFARDSASVDRGEAPIDFELSGAKFLGWALFNYSYKATDAKIATIDLYALWDRGAAEDPGPDEPGPEDPDEYDTPIQAALAKVLYYVGLAADFIRTLPAGIALLLPNWMNTLIRGWLYRVFGIEA